MSSNSKTEYNEFIRANLPAEITYDEVRAQYVTINGKRFPTYLQAKWYMDYIKKFGFASISAYAILSLEPPLVLDFDENYFRTDGTATDLVSAATHTRAGNATMVDSDGVLKWAPHNLVRSSADLTGTGWVDNGVTTTANAATDPYGGTAANLIVFGAGANRRVENSISGTIAGVAYKHSVWLKGLVGGEQIRVGSSATTASEYQDFTLTTDWFLYELYAIASGTTEFPLISAVNTDEPSIYAWGYHVIDGRLDMVNNPDTGNYYVPTTDAAKYLPRVGHHIWNGSSWVDEGYFHESEARTNLLLNSDTLSTQSVTVTAVPYTLHFTGTGTVTLTGASTAGPLVGTGTGEQNRVSLTFTPTAGTLIVTVTGTVTNADLEVGSTPSSYIPTEGATVTRAADLMTIPAANLPWNPLAVSIQMEGRQTGDSSTFLRWYDDANNYITVGSGASDYVFTQAASGTVGSVTGGSFTSGVAQPYNVASTHASTFVAAAVDGVALTDNTTPIALADLSANDVQVGYDFNGTIKLLRAWPENLTEAGREESSA